MLSHSACFCRLYNEIGVQACVRLLMSPKGRNLETRIEMQMLTRKQVAAMLAVSEPTVSRMAEDGRLPKPVKFGSTRQSTARWPALDIETRLAEWSEART